MKLNRLTYFGSDIFSVKILQNILEANNSSKFFHQLDIVTIGKSKSFNPIQLFAKQIDYIPTNVHTSCPHFIWSIGRQFGVVASYGRLISEQIIRQFLPNGIINIHPSLLPRWRGASPIPFTILTNDQITGVSLMRIDQNQFDTGDIIDQQIYEINERTRMMTMELLEELSDLSSQLIIKLLKELTEEIIEGDFIERNRRKQIDENFPIARRLTSSDFDIDWHQDAELILRQYRALSEIKPLRTMLNGKKLKIMSMRRRPIWMDKTNNPIGTVIYDTRKNCLVAKCGNEKCVGIDSLIYRKRMKSIDFFNGYMNKTESLYL
ncbi:hypothetical protein SNEBB_008963 [Seison nebaliae]|nr:hypothetical protein SNEBB_008963 [Seison nebaliae]